MSLVHERLRSRVNLSCFFSFFSSRLNSTRAKGERYLKSVTTSGGEGLTFYIPCEHFLLVYDRLNLLLDFLLHFFHFLILSACHEFVSLPLAGN